MVTDTIAGYSVINAPAASDPLNELNEEATLFRQWIQVLSEQCLREVATSGSVLLADVHDQALHTLEYALHLPSTWSVTRQLLRLLAPKMEWMGHRDDWLPFLEMGLRLSQVTEDSESAAFLHLSLGTLYQLRSKYTEAITHLAKSAERFALLQDTPQHGEALNRLAYIHCLQRDYTRAEEVVDEALHLLPVDAPIREFSYFVQGVIAEERGQLAEAVAYHQASLDLCLQTGNQRKAAVRTGDLGLVLQKLGRYEQAIHCYQRSIEMLGDLSDWFQQAIMQMNLGNVYLLEGNAQQALCLYQLAEPRFRHVQDERRLACVTLNIGIAYRELQQLDQAEQLLLSSLEQWGRLENLYWICNTLDDLGLVYQAKGHRSQAEATFRRAIEQLLPMKDQPGYDSLLTVITTHLNQMIE